MKNTSNTTRQTHMFSIYKEAESRPDKIESTSNNVLGEKEIAT